MRPSNRVIADTKNSKLNYPPWKPRRNPDGNTRWVIRKFLPSSKKGERECSSLLHSVTMRTVTNSPMVRCIIGVIPLFRARLSPPLSFSFSFLQLCVERRKYIPGTAWTHNLPALRVVMDPSPRADVVKSAICLSLVTFAHPPLINWLRFGILLGVAAAAVSTARPNFHRRLWFYDEELHASC